MKIIAFSARHYFLGKYKFPIASLVKFLSLILVVCFCNSNPIYAAAGALTTSEPSLSGRISSESALGGSAASEGEPVANITLQSSGSNSSVRFTVPGGAGIGRIREEDSGYGCEFTTGVFPWPLHAAGGTGNFNVRVRAIFDDGSIVDPPGALCPWGLFSNTPWISGQDPSDPRAWTTNSKTVGFHYSNNGGAPRLGQIDFHELAHHDVLQAGAIGCGEVIAGNYRPDPSYSNYGAEYPFEFPANEGDWIVLRIWFGENMIQEREYPVTITLPGTGAFSFWRTSQTGQYRVSLQFIKGGGCSTSIACGQTVSDQITTPLQMKAYRFSANAGEMVMVDINKTGSTSGSFFPNFRLYNPDGSQLIHSDGGVNYFGPLPETGTYTINVEDSDWYSNGLGTGTYDVGLQFLTGRCANTIACGQAFIGVPYSNNKIDAYKFSGTAGGRAGLFLNSTTGTSSRNGALFDPDGQFVTGDVPGIDGTEYGGSAQTWTLPKTGNYTYIVNPGSAGTYDLYRPCRGMCDAQLLGSSACLPAGGGIGTINVLIGPGCPWTSMSNASWAAIVSGGSNNKQWALTYESGPNVGNRRNGTLTIAGKTFNICQLGVGEVTPIMQLTPSSLNFGYIPVGSTKDLYLTVKNIGSGTLVGNATAAAPFNIVSGGNYSLGYNQSQVVTVRYQPTSPGTNTGTLVFTGGGGANIPVTGENGCSGDVVVLQNMTFTSGNTYNCTATTSITAGMGLTVQNGAIVNFRAPIINLQPGFRVENGAVFSAKQYD
ncbi:MAG: hypothetical protein FJ122_11705 [Deltaproteobacteria bacterium]|nr:hypothetical protein [Deltaproteobacteria bacterium]